MTDTYTVYVFYSMRAYIYLTQLLMFEAIALDGKISNEAESS